MPLPQNKEELFNNLHEAYKKLDDELDTVAVQVERHKGIEGHISCCDILAYQISWTRLLIGWDRSELNGEVPKMPAEGYKWNQLGKLAESFYENYSKSSLEHLRSEFRKVFEELLTWLDSLSSSELFDLKHRQWAGEKWPIVKWVQVNTIAPYRSARTKIRRWKKESGYKV